MDFQLTFKLKDPILTNCTLELELRKTLISTDLGWNTSYL